MPPNSEIGSSEDGIVNCVPYSFLTVGSSKRRPINRLQPQISLKVSKARKQLEFARCLLDIEDGISWVHGSLVLCGLTDQTFLVGEGDE